MGIDAGLTIMEVCGTHTASIAKSGLRERLPRGVRLVSGPGCPVCVTEPGYIDALIERSLAGACVLSFGDLFRVRGARRSFVEARAEGAGLRAEGADFRVIYSPFEAVALARENPRTRYILAAVGFETTAPLYALVLQSVMAEKLGNLKLCASLKTIIPAMELVCELGAADGFICPGHVSAVIGSDAYLPLLEKYGKPLVVAGFSPAEILAAVNEIILQAEAKRPAVVNLYPEVVSARGNERARALIDEYFERKNGVWRGLGEIAASALEPKARYSEYFIEAPPSAAAAPHGCRCADVLLGRIMPRECALFGGVCTPENPVGACMVSHEGACGIWYSVGGEA